ncbi:MAG: hypothetical protein ABFS45_08830, partial [Pseudomonadota bacterium]
MTKKRKLFDELREGVEAMQQQREGKITLRSHEIMSRVTSSRLTIRQPMARRQLPAHSRAAAMVIPR